MKRIRNGVDSRTVVPVEEGLVQKGIASDKRPRKRLRSTESATVIFTVFGERKTKGSTHLAEKFEVAL